MSEQTHNSSETDVLSDVFGVRHPDSDIFFSGSICGRSLHEPRQHLPQDQQALLHLLRRGTVDVVMNGKTAYRLDRPGLILFGKIESHELDTGEKGSDLVCAHVSFPGTASGPQVLGLPDCIVMPFDELPGLEAITMQLFAEAFGNYSGRKTAIKLLMDLLMLMLIRFCQAKGLVRPGVLAAMNDPRIARVVAAVNKNPGHAWSVESQAELAGMSRASFSAQFSEVLGASPGEFLQSLRLNMGRDMLRSGRSLQQIADMVGYGSPTAFARAFQNKYGVSPRGYLQNFKPEK